MKIRSLIFIFMLFSTLIVFFSTAISEDAQQNSAGELRGTFDYVATYESGSRAGTQTSGHRVTLGTLPDGQYQLNWGDLKVIGARIGDGLMYKWQSGEISGEGIYIIYDHGEKLFGTFRLKDATGGQRGYTQGTRVRLN
jgi:hypothetical protein